MTAFTLSKWAIKKIDRIRRNFLWKGAEDARSGHYLVNWRSVTRQKPLASLGIWDMAAFNWALRLRWLWHRWASPDKPWTGLLIQTNYIEEELCRRCTSIKLENGKRAKFWKDDCLNGREPKDIALECFKLAWRKNQQVAVAIQGGRWMRGLQRMNTDQELHQFVDLWSQLQNTPPVFNCKLRKRWKHRETRGFGEILSHVSI